MTVEMSKDVVTQQDKSFMGMPVSLQFPASHVIKSSAGGQALIPGQLDLYILAQCLCISCRMG